MPSSRCSAPRRRLSPAASSRSACRLLLLPARASIRLAAVGAGAADLLLALLASRPPPSRSARPRDSARSAANSTSVMKATVETHSPWSTSCSTRQPAARAASTSASPKRSAGSSVSVVGPRGAVALAELCALLGVGDHVAELHRARVDHRRLVLEARLGASRPRRSPKLATKSRPLTLRRFASSQTHSATRGETSATSRRSRSASTGTSPSAM